MKSTSKAGLVSGYPWKCSFFSGDPAKKVTSQKAQKRLSRLTSHEKMSENRSASRPTLVELDTESWKEARRGSKVHWIEFRLVAVSEIRIEKGKE